MLENVLKEMGDVSPKVAIGIDNDSGFTWEDGTYYVEFGSTSATLPDTVQEGKNEQ